MVNCLPRGISSHFGLLSGRVVDTKFTEPILDGERVVEFDTMFSNSKDMVITLDRHFDIVGPIGQGREPFRVSKHPCISSNNSHDFSIIEPSPGMARGMTEFPFVDYVTKDMTRIDNVTPDGSASKSIGMFIREAIPREDILFEESPTKDRGNGRIEPVSITIEHVEASDAFKFVSNELPLITVRIDTGGLAIDNAGSLGKGGVGTEEDTEDDLIN